jgi:ribosomal protein S18 acetylase RimI-like enzyme
MEKLQKEYGNKMGEFLSFGVLEDYRKIIDPVENDRIPNVLMKLVFTHFKTNNIKYSVLRILATNERAIRFYQKHSGYIIPSDNSNQVVILIET